MDFKYLAEGRRSVHHFVPGQKIPRDVFLDIIDLVQYTPSGYNAQPWEFVLIQDDENLQKIQDIAFDQKHITQAGNVVLLLGDTAFAENNKERILEEWEVLRGFDANQITALRASLEKNRTPEKWAEMTVRNCALAGMSLLYTAEYYGWQTCPMMGFSHRKICTQLNLPPNMIPVLMVALGKGDVNTYDQRLPRKKAHEVVHYEQYGNKKD